MDPRKLALLSLVMLLGTALPSLEANPPSNRGMMMTEDALRRRLTLENKRLFDSLSPLSKKAVREACTDPRCSPNAVVQQAADKEKREEQNPPPTPHRR